MNMNYYPPQPPSYPPYQGGYYRPPLMPLEDPHEPEIKKKRGELWTLCILLGGTVIAFFLLQIFFSFIALVAFPQMYDSGNDTLYYSLLIMIMVLSITIPFGLLSLYNKKPAGYSPWPTHKVKPSLFITVVIIGLAVTFLGNFVTNYISSFFSTIGINFTYPESPTPKEPYALFIYYVAYTIIPALCEEFAVRGVALGLLRRHGDGFAVWVSAITFAIMHGNMTQAPFALIMGLISAYLVIYTGSIWVSVSVHFLNNLLSCVFSMLTEWYGDIGNIVFIILFYGIIIVGVILLAVLVNKRHGFLKLKKKDYITKKSTRYYCYFCSPTVIISILIFIGLSSQLVQ